jgi:hypothetical protein
MNGIHEVTGSIPVWSTILPSSGRQRVANGTRNFHLILARRLSCRVRAGDSSLQQVPLVAI